MQNKNIFQKGLILIAVVSGEGCCRCCHLEQTKTAHFHEKKSSKNKIKTSRDFSAADWNNYGDDDDDDRTRGCQGHCVSRHHGARLRPPETPHIS